ncbi:hypothetical protein BC829DRAFT_439786 [Chytridium lagenaria]|nr:hypothetical protein BC829DRAFT_439786 [Chytridium lagenaria]
MPLDGLALLFNTASVFYTIYEKWDLKNSNDQAIILLKERIETLVNQISQQGNDSNVVSSAFQSMQEIVRRLQAAISSARMIVEKYASRNGLLKVACSTKHRDSLANVMAELNGCAHDLNLVFSLRIYADAESPEERRQREARFKKEIESISINFKAALQDDGKRYESLRRANVQSHREVREDLKELSKSVNKGFKKTIVSQVRSINLSQVDDFVTLHESASRIVQRCTFTDGQHQRTCIYKYINSSTRDHVDHREVDASETEMFSLSVLSAHNYFPKLIGKLEKDDSVGILVEYVSVDGDALKEPLTLRKYLTENIVEWSERLRFMRQIISAVAHMHKHNIIHNGLNSKQILIRREPGLRSFVKEYL